jgi:hypothetical protein
MLGALILTSGGQFQNPAPEPHTVYKLELELAHLTPVSSSMYLPVLQYWANWIFGVY